MQFAPQHAPFASSAAFAAGELLHLLEGWRALCLAGTDALAADNAEGLARALEARDGLRSRIEEAAARLRAQSGLDPRTLREISALADQAAAADAALLDRLEEARARIRAEMDTLRRGSDSAVAYLRPESPNPHRLDIIR